MDIRRILATLMSPAPAPIHPPFMACDERGSLAALLVSSILRSKPLFFIISAGNYGGALRPCLPPSLSLSLSLRWA